MELEAFIGTRPSARRDVRAWYEQLLELADRAGLSSAELATRLGCSRETIYAWRRRLRKKADVENEALKRELVRVQVAEPVAVPKTERPEVRTRSGHSILVPGAFDPVTLGAVVGVLEQC